MTPRHAPRSVRGKYQIGHYAPMAQSSISPAQSSVSPSRMEAFSDGVCSIAATLLVLEIAVHPPGTALELLRDAWLAHNAISDRLTRADSLLLRINLLLLLVIAFIPFPTKLVVEALHKPDYERVFVTL